MKNTFALFTVTLLFLGGCASKQQSHYIITTDAVALDEKSTEDTFVIVSGMKDVQTSSLRFKEFSNYVSNALEMKGYKKGNESDSNTLIVKLSYGIGEPRTNIESKLVPVYGGGQSTTYKNGSGMIVGSTQTAPSLNYVNQVSSSTSYPRFIVLEAFKNSDKKQAAIWETKILSVGSSDDLRKLFPIMILGAYPHIGNQTAGQDTVSIDIIDQDPRLTPILISPILLLQAEEVANKSQ